MVSLMMIGRMRRAVVSLMMIGRMRRAVVSLMMIGRMRRAVVSLMMIGRMRRAVVSLMMIGRMNGRIGRDVVLKSIDYWEDEWEDWAGCGKSNDDYEAGCL